MRWRGLGSLPLLLGGLLVIGCSDTCTQASAGVVLEVRFDGPIDQLHIAARNEDRVLLTGARPEEPVELTSPSQAILLIENAPAGADLAIDVEGFRDGALYARGATSVELLACETVLASVDLARPQPDGGSGDVGVDSGEEIACEPGWRAISSLDAPAARYAHTAVWTGSEMILWGGAADAATYFSTGASYDPAKDVWTPLSTSGSPNGRAYHTAVWTGSEMIVWGGTSDASDDAAAVNTGGRYDPAEDLWTPTTTTGAHVAQYVHVAAWTGSEMIVWGGHSSGSGKIYDPVTDAWSAVTTTNRPLGHAAATAVWTGSEMIVWGGYYVDGDSQGGGRYLPSADVWLPTPTEGAPSARAYHTAVWTGSEMILWGGRSWGFGVQTGGAFDPSVELPGAWSVIAVEGAPGARFLHTAVFTGSEMWVWGGLIGLSTRLSTGARYDVATGAWQPMDETDAPAARALHTAVWTGSEMIIWGGQGQDEDALADGGRSCP